MCKMDLLSVFKKPVFRDYSTHQRFSLSYKPWSLQSSLRYLATSQHLYKWSHCGHAMRPGGKLFYPRSRRVLEHSAGGLPLHGLPLQLFALFFYIEERNEQRKRTMESALLDCLDFWIVLSFVSVVHLLCFHWPGA